MLSPQPKHTPELEKPQLYHNKYSNAHTDALTPTQTHSRNTPTYYLPCRSSISITKQHGSTLSFFNFHYQTTRETKEVDPCCMSAKQEA